MVYRSCSTLFCTARCCFESEYLNFNAYNLFNRNCESNSEPNIKTSNTNLHGRQKSFLTRGQQLVYMSLNEKTGKVNQICQIKRRSKKVSNWLATICNDRDSNKNTDGEPFTLNHHLPRTEYLSSTVCQLTNHESCAGEICRM